MAKDETPGQYTAKLLTLFAALVGGARVRTTDHPEGVEVAFIMRGDPPLVRFDTGYGYETVPLDEVELAD